MSDMQDLYKAISKVVVADLVEFEKELKEQQLHPEMVGMDGLPLRTITEEVEMVGMDGLPLKKKK